VDNEVLLFLVRSYVGLAATDSTRLCTDTQFCLLLKTMLFCGAHETLP